MSEDDLIIFFRLCKAGYAASINEAAELDARTVIQALHYEEFLDRYERAYIELNKSKT